MKKRNGFVSNSSSASYIITVPVSKNQLVDILNKSGGTGFSFSSDLHYFLKNTIKVSEQRLEELENNTKENMKDLVASWKESYQEDLTKYKSILEKIDTYTDYDVFDIFCDLFKIQVDDLGAAVVLEGHTSMHNSYNEGMPEILKEIILVLTFESAIPFKAMRKDDY